MSANWKQEIENKRGAIRAFMNEQSIDVTSKFVPFSQSRNAKPDCHAEDKSLNWKITLVRNTRVLLTTDYMAGIGHCPSYKQGARWTLGYDAAINFECEEGHAAKVGWGSSCAKGNPIKPLDIDVLYSLVSDADVLNYSSFEDWASEFGYDADSRSAEKTYRACLEIALALRNGLGNDNLAKLQTLFQDY